MTRKNEIAAIVGAMMVVLFGIAVFLYTQSFQATPTPSVEGREQPNEQPAGPADRSALPGS